MSRIYQCEDLAPRRVVAFYAVQHLDHDDDDEEHSLSAGNFGVRLEHILDRLPAGLDRVVLEGVQVPAALGGDAAMSAIVELCTRSST